MQTSGWWKETQKYNVDKNVVILSFRCLGLRNSTVLVTLPAEKCFTVGHFRNINLIQHSLKQYFIPTIRMICPRSYLATVQKLMSTCQNVVLLQKWKFQAVTVRARLLSRIWAPTLSTLRPLQSLSDLSQSCTYWIFIFLRHVPTSWLLREGPKKKRFYLEKLSQIFEPTHTPQGFCEIWEHKRWNSGQKRRFSGWFGFFWAGMGISQIKPFFWDLPLAHLPPWFYKILCVLVFKF